MEEGEKKSGFFGRKLEEIPCFRSTFLFSISSGIGGGLAYFLFTSKVKRACDFAVLTFGVTTVGYWAYCRYNYSKKFIIPKDILKEKLESIDNRKV